jgi:hypothetical protein
MLQAHIWVSCKDILIKYQTKILQYCSQCTHHWCSHLEQIISGIFSVWTSCGKMPSPKTQQELKIKISYNTMFSYSCIEHYWELKWTDGTFHCFSEMAFSTRWKYLWLWSLWPSLSSAWQSKELIYVNIEPMINSIIPHIKMMREKLFTLPAMLSVLFLFLQAEWSKYMQAFTLSLSLLQVLFFDTVVICL